MNRLQSVLNAAAWLVFSVSWPDNITQLLRVLLCTLRVPEQIQFRLYALAYRCLHGTVRHISPQSSIWPWIFHFPTRCRLRPAVSSTLLVPPTWRSFLGDSTFPVAARREWNWLPSSVRKAYFCQLFVVISRYCSFRCRSIDHLCIFLVIILSGHQAAA